jgi:hypothetical protein
MTPLLELRRVSVGPEGAFGVLLHYGIPFAVTLEHTYEQPGEPVTKIPPGRHPCAKTVYHKGGYPTYEVRVYGHSRLLFHRGNVEADSDGCILVGESYAQFDMKPGVGQSAAAFLEFMTRMAGAEEFELLVS